MNNIFRIPLTILRNRPRPIVEILHYIATIVSVMISLVWLMYAAINGSGHTSIDPYLVMRIQLAPIVMIMVSSVIMKDPFSFQAFRALITAAVFGLAIPVVLEISGVLQEYNRWCKNGLSEPSWIKIYAFVIVLGTGLAIAMKRAMKQSKNSTFSANKSEVCE